MDFSLFTRVTSEFQSLQAVDLLTVGTLAMLEGLLSVDNALVLAILVRSLPKRQQKKALMYGLAGAFTFRFLALIFAAYLMKLVVFKFIGGGYLIFLAMKHMFFVYKEDAHQARTKVSSSFWKTVVAVELTDVAFSIDSITAAVAMSDKIIVVWAGGIMGIIFLRFAAGFFVRLLERLPKLEDLAYQLVFFVGTKLFLEGFGMEIHKENFWLMMGVIVILGSALVWRDYRQRKSQTTFQDRLLERFIKGEAEVQELLTLEYIPRRVMDFLRSEGYVEIKDKGQPSPPAC